MTQSSASQTSPGACPPRLHYLSYAAVAGMKQMLGLGLDRNRKFLVWKLIRLLESGRIRADRLAITAAGKTDGVGAQGLARFTARVLANAYGLRYIHTPFRTLAHAELPQEAWIRTWEQQLDLGHAATDVDTCSLPTISLADYLSNPSLWKQEVLLTNRHFHPFIALAPEASTPVTKTLQGCFHGTEPAAKSRDSLNICLHVRRGDVRPGDSETQHRFTANTNILPVFNAVLQAAAQLGKKVKARLYSNGLAEDFREFEHFTNLELHLGTPALDTFNALARADVLITTRSDFSHLAAIYCRGLVICDPRHRTPLPHWLTSNPDSRPPDTTELALAIEDHSSSL